MTTLAGSEVVLGVTGGIAAYKACEIIRELRKEGANVVVILTASGSQFITPLTLQTLSRNPVHTDLFNLISESDVGHISLAQRANLLLIAPATANTIGKICNGIADDLLSTVAMATTAPILLAPAMNNHMYASAAVRENIEALVERGVTFVEPGEGELACGATGPGRLADTGKILEMARIMLAEKILEGKKVVVSAGPTAEDIDPVRFITNRASGKMGFAMAIAARRFGADVTLVTGPTRLPDPPFLKVEHVRSAQEMGNAVAAAGENANVIVMAAAVADMRPLAPAARKIPKKELTEKIDVVRTEDILANLGELKRQRVLVGFAAETNDIEGRAREKLRNKNLDAIVANDVSRRDIGFDSDSNEVKVLFSDGTALDFVKASKEAIAAAVLRAITVKFLRA
ncbi:MAG: bifunctional phosphopantothenoylcysteine decarboxylase/phosphopantothenate--cysteine ligase CoaBC [Syntrophorhabdaceae bacterium]|nr:bifunctional phosphopantothenoylcysteine decarboxylase/phosphopantothenate--cysteine ligase CoaBC [Syntrophorhabdaceae bacterium]